MKKERNPLLPNYATVRRWSVEIGCDPRSIEREILKPGSVTGEAGIRVRKGIVRMRAEVRKWEVEQARISAESRAAHEVPS